LPVEAGAVGGPEVDHGDPAVVADVELGVLAADGVAGEHDVGCLLAPDEVDPRPERLAGATGEAADDAHLDQRRCRLGWRRRGQLDPAAVSQGGVGDRPGRGRERPVDEQPYFRPHRSVGERCHHVGYDRIAPGQDHVEVEVGFAQPEGDSHGAAPFREEVPTGAGTRARSVSGS
jgi:hypothetical protein